MVLKTDRPNIIDIEASGFGANSYPIEIGIVMNNDYRYCSLILPDKRWTHWDEEAEKLHGVSRTTLKTYGKPIRQVTSHLNTLLENQTVYSDCWVVDQPWLSALFFTANIKMQFYISPLENILNEDQMEQWHSTKDNIISETKGKRHRASYDAWVIQETFHRTLKMNRQ